MCLPISPRGHIKFILLCIDIYIIILNYKVYSLYEKFLIYNFGGGLGDLTQLFPLLISLKGHFRKLKFYCLGAHSNHFDGKLKEYNINLETLDLGLNILVSDGMLMARKTTSNKFSGKFDLIIDLQLSLEIFILKRTLMIILFQNFGRFFFHQKNTI